MVHKEYKAPEYYAQTCTDFIKGAETDKKFLKGLPKNVKKDIYDVIGASFKASHHGSRVFIDNIPGIECIIDFGDKNIDNPDAILEITNKNGSSHSYEKKMKVGRSKEGRLNPVKTYVPFFEEFIIPHLREALKEK